MFEPTERYNLVELLRPPAGYRLNGAVGTTYSMDFVALTAILLAFVDSEIESSAEDAADVERSYNPIQVLQAFLRLRDRVRIFVQRGGILAAGKTHRLSLQRLYDRIVTEVAPEHGCFHPKVWVCQFEPRQTVERQTARPLVRVICGSRNLSTSRCWEAFTAFEGVVNGSRIATPLKSGVRRMLEQLGDQADKELLDELSAAVMRASFPSAKPFADRCEFRFQSASGDDLWSRFPSRVARALVVTPFVRAGFLRQLLSRVNDLTLLTTQRELDRIDDVKLHELLDEHEILVVESSGDPNGDAQLDLHAKIYLCEDNSGTLGFIGSANASSSAWGCGGSARNWEALVAFAPAVSVAQFRKAFLCDGDGNLRRWIHPYQRLEVRETEQEKLEDESDKLKDALARIPLELSWCEAQQQLSLHLTRSARKELGELLHRRATAWDIRLAPMALEEQMIGADALAVEDQDFSGATLSDYGEFMVWQISSRAQQLVRRFIVKARLRQPELLEKRETEFLKAIASKTTFAELLMVILFDAAVRPTDSFLQSLGSSDRENHRNWTVLGDACLEDVLRACTEDPTKMDDIDRLVHALDGTDAVDQSFKTFWQELQSAFLVAARAEGQARD